MTPFQEACLLPALFLTVVLAGGVRPGQDLSLVVPSLASLITSMILFAIFVQSGTLAPERLMNAARSSLANLNGLVVLVTAFAASAQVFTLVTPATGLPAVIVWIVICALLIQALAVGPDRTRLLRGLLVTFGTAFALKFIVLAALSGPPDTRVGRVVQLLFEGITLGAVTQPPLHPAEGYLAFATLVLYLIGVAWLPSAEWRMVRLQTRDALIEASHPLDALETRANGRDPSQLL